MSTPTQIKATFLAARTDDHTGAGAAYAALGTPISVSSLLLIISSTYDKSVWFSTDGSTDMILIPALTVVQIDIAGNKQGDGRLSFPSYTQIYIKQGPDGAPTTGDIAVTAMYGT